MVIHIPQILHDATLLQIAGRILKKKQISNKNTKVYEHIIDTTTL